MDSNSLDSGRKSDITLYNPSSEEAEALDPSSVDRTVLDIKIDRGLAERLLEVSKHLGLNPTIVASRAIDLVCEEIGTLKEGWRQDEEEFGTVTLIQRYQARVELLQALKEESEETPGTEISPKHQTLSPADAESHEEDGEEEGKLEQKGSDESKEVDHGIPEAKNWDAVEAIIETGEQAKE
jgi:hypothetical protein